MEGAGGRCYCFDRSKRSGGDPETAVFVGSHSRRGEWCASGPVPGGGNCAVGLSEPISIFRLSHAASEPYANILTKNYTLRGRGSAVVEDRLKRFRGFA